MKRVFSYILLLTLIGTPQCYGQSNQELRALATEAMSNKDWHGASQYYNRLYLRDSTQLRTVYRYAEAARLNFEVDVAVRLYKRCMALDEGRRFPLAAYWLGQLQKNREHYPEARKWFSQFLKTKDSRGRYARYLGRAREELDICAYAEELLSNRVREAVDAVEALNTRMSEYAPMQKDSTMYLSSVRVPERRESPAEPPAYSMIYTSQIRNGELQKLRALDTNINAAGYHHSNSCFSADKKEMIISRCMAKNAAEYQCQLYTSMLGGKKWMIPVRIPEPVNSATATTTQPNLAEVNGRTLLFFSSDRAGGEGGMDIWYAIRDGNGIYSDPVNAGKSVNTNEDEITPFFDSKTKTLYFSSTYHQTMGGYDIFRSGYRDNGFTKPENAGYPINSGFNETYFSMNSAGTRAYFASNRPLKAGEGSSSCCSDIYSFSIDTVSPRPAALIDTIGIFKNQMTLLVPLTLYFHNDEPDPRTRDTVTVKNYETTYRDYSAMLPRYRKEYSKGLKGIVKENAIDDVEDFFADSVETGFFELERFSDLLEKVLRNGETVRVTMRGYCSPLASSDYNIRLAKRRISSLKNYFLSTKGGLFAGYLAPSSAGKGRLIFQNVDVGELVESKVSDNVRDTQNSVFSPFAASERKIQIIAVSFGKP